jgi:hypothetical protein
MESFEHSDESSQKSLTTNHIPIRETNTILKVKGAQVSAVYLGKSFLAAEFFLRT